VSSGESFKTFIAIYHGVKPALRKAEAFATRHDERFTSALTGLSHRFGLDKEESSWLKPWSAFLIFFALLLTRSWHWIAHPQFYIEDGPEFYGIAFNAKGHELGTLFQIYMGYYHLIPRLISVAASEFPPSQGPLLMELSALAIQALAGSVFLSSRLKEQMPSIGVRALCGLLVIGFPYSNELFGNVAHSQWYLALFATILLCARPGDSILSRVCDFIAIGLIGLTGPFSLILAPLAWLVAKRDRHRLMLASLLSAEATFTVISIFTHPRFGAHGNPRLSLFERMLSNQVVIGATLGFNRAVEVPYEPFQNLPELVYSVFCVIVLGFGIWKGRTWVRGIAAIGLFTLLTSLYSGSNWRMLGSGGVGERYFLYLGLLYVVSCGLISQQSRLASVRWGFRAILLATCFGVAWNWVYAPPFPQFEYGPQIAAFSSLRPGEQLQIQMPIDRKSPTSHWTVSLTKP
jgi:hypothetical protein